MLSSVVLNEFRNFSNVITSSEHTNKHIIRQKVTKFIAVQVCFILSGMDGVQSANMSVYVPQNHFTRQSMLKSSTTTTDLFHISFSLLFTISV